MYWVGPQLGFHNEEVIKELLHYSAEKIVKLKEQEVVFEEGNNKLWQ